MNGRDLQNPWKRGRGGHGGGRPRPQKQTAEPKPATETNIVKDAEKRFEEARAKLQASAQKSIQEYESSSDEEQIESTNVLDSVLKNYQQFGKDLNLGRTGNFLEESFQTNALVCLICIASVKRLDAIWSCVSCYSFFHINCIQRWATDTIAQQSLSEENMSLRIDHTFKKNEWCCPKCRHSYAQEEYPKKYECFCKKCVDPPYQPWLVPHSCGEICNKELQPTCGHRCLLLCHPGPCPPCPKTVTVKCLCGQNGPKPVRCGSATWSCGQTCNQLLACKSHRCRDICHEGPCAPCSKTSVQSCICGSEKMKRSCEQAVWQCEKVCQKPLSCGHHKCAVVCHPPDACKHCPLSGVRSCPCGVTRRQVTCPEEVAPCGDTCAKPLNCGIHSCTHKCHKDACPPCLIVITKHCRCRASQKETACSRDVTCNTKCGASKACGRHACARKCCPGGGTCPPCERVCGMKLQCGRHKCSAPCHRGPCYPCPLTSKVSCRCGATYVTVPCGREKKTKIPRCLQKCKIPYPCKHGARNIHSCHLGPCPPCLRVCEEPLARCGHGCLATCHAAVPVTVTPTAKPATPWEVQAVKVEVHKLPCPPCETPVPVLCLGRHETITEPCHSAKRRPCYRACGQHLPCGNHTCDMRCHLIDKLEEDGVRTTECQPCDSGCTFDRPPACTHACPRSFCHPGTCPPCRAIVRVTCHCRLTELYVRCEELTRSYEDGEAREKLYSCQQQCVKKLSCGHRCKHLCHSGECVLDEPCTKKTKVYCPCKNIKRELSCKLVMSGEAQLLCDDSCEVMRRQEQLQKQAQEEKRKALEEEKNRKELEEFQMKFSKKKYKEKKVVVEQKSIPIWQKWWFLGLTVTVGIIGVICVVLNTD